MQTIDGVEAYAHAHASDFDWEGNCERFIYRAGGFTQSFSSALLAGDASGPLDPNPVTAKRGELHYFSGAGGFGHVAFELGGNLLLMASGAVTTDFGLHLGTVVFSDYTLRKPLVPYRGHTFLHGTQTLDLSGTASDTVTPLTTWSDPMFAFVKDATPSDVIFIVSLTTGRRAKVANMVDYNILATLQKGAAAQVDMFPKDLDTAQAYLAAINPPAGPSSPGDPAATATVVAAITALPAATADLIAKRLVA